MITSIQLMDMVKAKQGLTSDYSLTKIIGCSKSFIYTVRSTECSMGFEYALHCAEILGLDPLRTLASMGAEIATKKGNENAKQLWLKYV
jgi:hypothetical protein